MIFNYLKLTVSHRSGAFGKREDWYYTNERPLAKKAAISMLSEWKASENWQPQLYGLGSIPPIVNPFSFLEFQNSVHTLEEFVFFEDNQPMLPIKADISEAFDIWNSKILFRSKIRNFYNEALDEATEHIRILHDVAKQHGL